MSAEMTWSHRKPLSSSSSSSPALIFSNLPITSLAASGGGKVAEALSKDLQYPVGAKAVR